MHCICICHITAFCSPAMVCSHNMVELYRMVSLPCTRCNAILQQAAQEMSSRHCATLQQAACTAACCKKGQQSSERHTTNLQHVSQLKALHSMAVTLDMLPSCFAWRQYALLTWSSGL